MGKALTNKSVRFTVDEYFKMDRSGLFDDQRVELVMGRILKVNAQANPHRWAISKGSRRLQQLFAPERFWVVVQGTLVLGRYGAPDPDFHVLDVPEGTEDAKLPRPFLVIEVSDSTYAKDSGIKLRQFASAGIADYWIVNIPNRRVEVYRDPHRSPARYESVNHHAPGATIALLAQPQVQIAVDDLLP